MKVTQKGQVTIPIEIREQAGIYPNSEIEFQYRNGNVILKKITGKNSPGKKIVDRLQNSNIKIKLTTDQLMKLTRN
jgi:AbrB family looped-hinge helix DNA binding protein